MVKYKLIIKIITYIIIIFSFYNLYSLKDFFIKEKLPLQSGDVFVNTSSYSVVDSSEVKSEINVSEIIYTEDGKIHYNYDGNKGQGTIENTYYVRENEGSVIEWNDTLKRWIKIGDLNNLDNLDKKLEESLKAKYSKYKIEGGKNLGCVYGNNRHNIHSCKAWKNNFGIGNQETLPVFTRDVIDVFKRSNKEETNNYILPIIIICVIIFIIIVIFMLKNRK